MIYIYKWYKYKNIFIFLNMCLLAFNLPTTTAHHCRTLEDWTTVRKSRISLNWFSYPELGTQAKLNFVATFQMNGE